MLTREIAVRRVKSIQKALLLSLEQSPEFQYMEPHAFNSLRKHIFKATFAAYRLGILGVEPVTDKQLACFFVPVTDLGIRPEDTPRVIRMAFASALAAFRLGSLVSMLEES